VNEIKNDSTEVIVMMDANETLGEERLGIMKFLEKTGMVDIMTRHHPMTCRIATQATSRNRRIDFLFSSPGILPFIVKCGYLPFYSGIESDHRGAFVDLDNTIIDREVYLTTLPPRMITTTSKKSEVYKYKHSLLSKFKDHRIVEKATKIWEDADPIMENDKEYNKQLNEIDALVTTLMLSCESKNCGRRPATEWSLPIHYSSLLITY
jgi:hypothetical protein